MKVLVIGANGQLGQCLKKVAAKRDIRNLVFPDEAQADILNITALDNLFAAEKPQFVINCAAYTAVDKAENDEDKAQAINAVGAKNLAMLCGRFKAVLIHISTDFVFEGSEVKLLKEDDEAMPINVYGQTKLNGEREITATLQSYVILRTSWLYSEFAHNFVKTMLKLGAERDELNIIADQVGTPTYAIDLAHAILDVIQADKHIYGVYHCSNEGVTSWYDFAKAIFDLSGTTVRVNPISTSACPTPAKRPGFAVMDKSKIKKDYHLQIPHWRDSLAACIQEIKRLNN